MRRSTLEIRTEILEKSKENIKPTRLMYATGITYDNMLKHVEILKSKNLIEEIALDEATIKKDKRTTINYRTTHEGIEILRSLKNVIKICDDLLD